MNMGPAGRSPIAAYFVLAVAVGLAAWVFLAGLGSTGLQGPLELAAYQRVDGLLGGHYVGLERAPLVPDLLRALAMQTVGRTLGQGGELGLRLADAMACVAVVAAICLLQFRCRRSPQEMLLTVGFVLASPALACAGRSATGMAIGEAASAWAITGLLHCLAPPTNVPNDAAGVGSTSGLRRAIWGLVGGLALATACASLGIILGGALPLAGLAALAALAGTTSEHLRPRPQTATRWASALSLTAAVVGLWLLSQRGDGFIPLLAQLGPPQPSSVATPAPLELTAPLAQFSAYLYPWAGFLLAAGLLRPRDAYAAALRRWLGLCLVAACLWLSLHPRGPLPLVLPIALVCGQQCASVASGQLAGRSRRVVIVLFLVCMALLHKDARGHAGRFVRVWESEPVQSAYLSDIGDIWQAASESPALGEFNFVCGLGLLTALLLAPSLPGATNTNPKNWTARQLAHLRALVPTKRRRQLATLLACTTLVLGARGLHRGVHGHEAALNSPRPVLAQFASWARKGWVPAELGVHGQLSPMIQAYLPGDLTIESLAYRTKLRSWLDETDRQCVLVTRPDFALAVQTPKTSSRPRHVLDLGHRNLFVVCNEVAEQVPTIDPLGELIVDAQPQLAHETQLKFADYLEIIGWEFSNPIRRGQEATLTMAMRVHRRLPSTAKIYARLQMGKLSRINAKSRPLASDLYPPSYWRKGDIVVHRQSFPVSYLSALPGQHEFIVGLQRSSNKNVEISQPEGKRGPYGVRVRGKKRNFATIGKVMVH